MERMHQICQEQMEAQLKDSAAKIDALKEMALSAGAREKLKYYDLIEDLRIKETGARLELADLRAASNEAWEEQRGKVEAALRSLHDGLTEPAGGQ